MPIAICKYGKILQAVFGVFLFLFFYENPHLLFNQWPLKYHSPLLQWLVCSKKYNCAFSQHLFWHWIIWKNASYKLHNLWNHFSKTMSQTFFYYLIYWESIRSFCCAVEIVFCYQNCSDLLWEKIVLEWLRKTFDIWGWSPRIFNIFEITRTIYSNSERSEQFLVTEKLF